MISFVSTFISLWSNHHITIFIPQCYLILFLLLFLETFFLLFGKKLLSDFRCRSNSGSSNSGGGGSDGRDEGNGGSDGRGGGNGGQGSDGGDSSGRGNGGNGGNGGEVDPADELVGFMLGMGSVSDNKEEKMRTFQSVCGFDEEQALFYLEANSWNVDLAVSSFFANQQAAPVVIEYHLAAMATDHNQTQTVEGGEVFSKSWKLANTGTRAWPTGCYVSLHTGDPHGAQPIE